MTLARMTAVLLVVIMLVQAGCGGGIVLTPPGMGPPASGHDPLPGMGVGASLALAAAGGIVGGITQWGTMRLLDEIFGAGGSRNADLIEEIAEGVKELRRDIVALDKKISMVEAAIQERLDELRSEAKLDQLELHIQRINVKFQDLTYLAGVDFANLDRPDDFQDFTPDSGTWDGTGFDPVAFQNDILDANVGIRAAMIDINTWVMGTPQWGGVLDAYTEVLIDYAGHGAPVYDLFMNLESLFCRILNTQALGAVLIMNAAEASLDTSGTTSLSPQHSFPYTPEHWRANILAPRLEKQVDRYLSCVERLVASQTKRTWDSAEDETYIQQAAQDIFFRADFLAHVMAPNKHPAGAVVRLIGDPRNVVADPDGASVTDQLKTLLVLPPDAGDLDVVSIQGQSKRQFSTADNRYYPELYAQFWFESASYSTSHESYFAEASTIDVAKYSAGTGSRNTYAELQWYDMNLQEASSSDPDAVLYGIAVLPARLVPTALYCGFWMGAGGRDDYSQVDAPGGWLDQSFVSRDNRQSEMAPGPKFREDRVRIGVTKYGVWRYKTSGVIMGTWLYGGDAEVELRVVVTGTEKIDWINRAPNTDYSRTSQAKYGLGLNMDPSKTHSGTFEGALSGSISPGDMLFFGVQFSHEITEGIFGRSYEDEDGSWWDYFHHSMKLEACEIEIVSAQ